MIIASVSCTAKKIYKSHEPFIAKLNYFSFATLKFNFSRKCSPGNSFSFESLKGKLMFNKVQSKLGFSFDKHRHGVTFHQILINLNFHHPSRNRARLEAAPALPENRVNKKLKRMILCDYRHFTSTLYNSFTLKYFREESS